MEAVIAGIAFMFFAIMIAILVMLAKLLFGSSANSPERVYMLKVDEHGNIRIRRYRGSIKYWNEK